MPPLEFYNNPLEHKTECKFLGVMLDNNLRFNSHVDFIAGKISKSIGLIYRIRNFRPKSAIFSLYYALIFSYLKYCVLIWGGASQVHLQKVFLLQKKIVRIMFNTDYFAHTDPLFHSGGVLKISDIFRFSIGVYMFKHRNSFIQFGSHGYDTRNSSNLVPSFHRMNCTQRSLSFIGPTIWNNIPDNIRNLTSEPVFRKLLKKYLTFEYASR